MNGLQACFGKQRVIIWPAMLRLKMGELQVFKWYCPARQELSISVSFIEIRLLVAIF
jgi:hypothetical protein